MFALRVRINNEEPVTGGADDLGVITACVTGVGTLGQSSVPRRPDEGQEFFFHLGGLTARGSTVENNQLYWLQQYDLKVGDTVTIEVVEVDSASPVVRSRVGKDSRTPKT